MTNDLTRFRKQRTVLLTTFKRDGTPVGTPVSIAFDGDRAFMRTYDAAWKSKRLRNNPAVEVAPSTAKGKPTGPAVPARTRLLTDPEEIRAARRALGRKHPFLHRVAVPLAHKLKGWHTLHYEVTPVP
jgi:PPOX class probable F420-dependent enzyme